MIEIIPNWHPIFVHFTIGLLGTAVVLHASVAFHLVHKEWRDSITVTARGCLWLGSFSSIMTVIAGWIAYNTVPHDSASHAAMTVHRNWAMTTFSLFAILTGWSVRQTRRGNTKGGIRFTLVLLVGGTPSGDHRLVRRGSGLPVWSGRPLPSHPGGAHTRPRPRP